MLFDPASKTLYNQIQLGSLRAATRQSSRRFRNPRTPYTLALIHIRRHVFPESCFSRARPSPPSLTSHLGMLRGKIASLLDRLQGANLYASVCHLLSSVEEAWFVGQTGSQEVFKRPARAKLRVAVHAHDHCHEIDVLVVRREGVRESRFVVFRDTGLVCDVVVGGALEDHCVLLTSETFGNDSVMFLLLESQLDDASNTKLRRPTVDCVALCSINDSAVRSARTCMTVETCADMFGPQMCC